MRLSEYPFITVRIACSKCARQGSYRLARLADRYGAEIEMTALLGHLAADCERRDTRARVYDYCGAFYPDLRAPRPPDEPATARTRLRVVR